MRIEDVERATGIAKATLRVWKQRYGFPSARREAGRLTYSPADVELLRHAANLVRRGFRPKRIFSLEPAEVARLARTADSAQSQRIRSHPVVRMVREHDVSRLRASLAGALAPMAAREALEWLATALRVVGAAWQCGEITVFEEHAFVDCAQDAIRSLLGGLSPPHRSAPRALLATPEGEWHGLGLLFARGAMRLEGLECISLGPSIPATQMIAAARAYRCDVLGVSVSGAAGTRATRSMLRTLVAEAKRELPGCAVWVGGGTPELCAGVEGIRRVLSLDDAREACRELLAARRRQRRGQA